MNSKLIYISLLACALSGCTVLIHDAEFCGDAGPLGASCFHLLTDDARDIAKPQWDTERFGMICTSGDNFANWKAELLKLCDGDKNCTFEMKNKIASVSDKVIAKTPRHLKGDK